MAIPVNYESYQSPLSVSTLYYVKNSGRGTERQASGISVRGGTVDIYGSFRRPSSLPSDMILAQAGFSGIDTFEIIPTYLYIVTASGTPIITVSSIEAEIVT